MTIKVSKPAINIREKLNDLDFDKVPFQKMPAGSVLQVVQSRHQTRIAVTNTTTKLIEASINLTNSNSKILCTISTSIGNYATYTDDDLALAIGYKVGTSGSSSSEYTQINNTYYTRDTVPGLGSFFATDTHEGGSTGSQYWVEEKTYSRLFTTTLSTPSTLYVALWADSDSGTYHFGGGSGSAATDSGSETWMTLMEVAQ